MCGRVLLLSLDRCPSFVNNIWDFHFYFLSFDFCATATFLHSAKSCETAGGDGFSTEEKGRVKRKSGVAASYVFRLMKWKLAARFSIILFFRFSVSSG